MRKFWNLLKKETKELINAQLIISLVFTFLLFYLMGTLVQGEMAKAAAPQEIALLDLDSSDLSRGILNGLSSANFKVIPLTAENEQGPLKKPEPAALTSF